MPPDELQSHAAACLQLVGDCKTLLLASVTEAGLPEISYAPYTRDTEGVFYIYVSELAPHTKNLLTSRQAAVLFIRDEADSPNLFARERLSLQCNVDEPPRESETHRQTVEIMKETHGEVVTLLSSLPDFHLLALTPKSGRYVVGFGKAFRVDPANFSLEPIGPEK